MNIIWTHSKSVTLYSQYSWKFNKDNFGIARTPVDVTLHFSKNKVESVSQAEYSRLIGSLIIILHF